MIKMWFDDKSKKSENLERMPSDIKQAYAFGFT